MSPSPNPVAFWSAPELWRIEFVLRASRIARVLLIEASSHSGCQAHGGDLRARSYDPPSGRGEIARVWCLRVPGRPCRAGSRPAGDCSQCPAVGALLRCGVVARGARGPRLMSATFPTRLETRTKESNMCASRGAVRKPARRSEGECRRGPAEVRPGGPRLSAHHRPILSACRRGRARACVSGPERW
ncbi:unnamed protein product [Clavelina lepadiformis]|uniref:Uncharacterized protein n=1 Tax=Clavelina lepadiformis TaxID=159417 RepID=A0ABP0H3Y1_CLALP